MRRIFRIILFVLLSIPKTIYFNFASLPFRQAIRFPFLIGYNVKIIETHSGIVKLPEEVKMGLIRIGYGGSIGIQGNRGYICLEKGRLEFLGSATFAMGASIRVSGTLSIGKNFSANKNCFISCADSICFGSDNLLGWNCSIRDSDGHYIIKDGKEKQISAPVTFGNHVWICSESHILKGVDIGDDSVVAYGSLVTRGCKNNTLIGGCPGKVLDSNISWKY